MNTPFIELRLLFTSFARATSGAARKAVLLLFFVVLLAGGTGAARRPSALDAIFVVDSTGDGDDTVPGNGICDDGTGNCTLRAAIEEANANASDDIIQFSIPTSDPGYNAETVVWTITLLQALPDLSTNMVIEGPGADRLTVSGGNVHRIFKVTQGEVSFSGMTIANGVEFEAPGGGIYNGGTTTVTNSTIRDNHSDKGGGIYNEDSMTVTNSTISGNSSPEGGGIYNEGTMTVIDSTISGNTGYFFGGGIANYGPLIVANTTISDNSTVCLSLYKATPEGPCDNLLFGGGIYSEATVTVTNSTISRNYANGGGGGIWGGPLRVKNSIIAGNGTASSSDGPDVFGSVTSSGFNLIGQRDGSTGFTQPTDQTGTTASPLDPQLDPNGLQSNGGPTQTIALLPTSPAIDKATRQGLTGALTTDQRGTGFARTYNDPSTPNATGGDGTDIGAFELQPPAAPTPTPHPPHVTPTPRPHATPTPRPPHATPTPSPHVTPTPRPPHQTPTPMQLKGQP